MRLKRAARAAAAVILATGIAWTGPTPANAAAPTPVARKTFSGEGDDVVRIKTTKQRGIATLTHEGESNIQLWTIEPSGKDGELPVNEIGDYSGTVVFNTYMWSKTAGFKVEADGAWTLKVAPISYAPLWKYLTVKGQGDKVLKLAKPTAGIHTLRYKHAGKSNFQVYAYPLAGNSDLLVNKIGAVSGRVVIPAGTKYVSVTADGKWSLARR